MNPRNIPEGDVSTDGHPCEAALQFRKAVVRSGVADEVSADALDLAISFAWIGKAISRTDVAAEWIVAGVDPNTYLIVPLLSCSGSARAVALEIAVKSKSTLGMERELRGLRSSKAFRAAVGAVKDLLKDNPSALDVIRLSELADVSCAFPAYQRTLPSMHGTGNVVMLDKFRRRRQAAN